MEVATAEHNILPRAMIVKNYISLMIVFLLYPIHADTGSSYIKPQKLSGVLLLFQSVLQQSM